MNIKLTQQGINQIREAAIVLSKDLSCPSELSAEQFRIMCIALASADYFQSIGSPVNVQFTTQSTYTGPVDE